MRPAIAGSASPHSRELTSSIVWPSIGATRYGRLIGQWASDRRGIGPFTLGKVWALASVPLALGVFAWQLLPFVTRRYRITDRRILIEKGLSAVEESSLGLDQFDAIDLAVLPGQDWLHAGEVIFLRGGKEVFRLSGVSRPEAFRQICLKAQNALVSVRQAMNPARAAS